VKLARARVGDGKADRLREWYAELERREAEVRETLAHEGVLTESAFLDERDGATYLYVLVEADGLAAAQAAGDEEAFDIDDQAPRGARRVPHGRLGGPRTHRAPHEPRHAVASGRATRWTTASAGLSVDADSVQETARSAGTFRFGWLCHANHCCPT
jgi:hypothetical protein